MLFEHWAPLGWQRLIGVKEVCRLLDIEKTRTTPQHPQSDGMVERLNRMLETMLSKFVEENQQNWDQLLPLLAMTYLSAIHASTGLYTKQANVWTRCQATCRSNVQFSSSSSHITRFHWLCLRPEGTGQKNTPVCPWQFGHCELTTKAIIWSEISSKFLSEGIEGVVVQSSEQ